MYHRIMGTTAAVICWAISFISMPAYAAADGNDFIETGDLTELRAHGRLRILLPVPHAYETYLPRQGFPIQPARMSRYGRTGEWVLIIGLLICPAALAAHPGRAGQTIVLNKQPRWG